MFNLSFNEKTLYNKGNGIMSPEDPYWFITIRTPNLVIELNEDNNYNENIYSFICF